ncbi:MAG TPA: hypothetical protein VGV07_21355 [Devosia sp.]|uniref:hypothetical protein n=1 Tax=Devosia sp. TaxID=1871048 RepID=UPI002DDCAC34|nr:hypothetical protein [Devosia sp.]HEV2517814.1 hypothetical protein [Devosia sp.]
MEALLGSLEQLALIKALKTSFFAYPIVNALHVLAIGALVTAVLLMDLRIVGVISSIEEQPFVRLLRRVALGAFGLAVLTGALMFAVRATEYAGMPLFWIKMGLIGLAGLNFVAFSLLRQPAGKRALACVSILLWPTVLLAGRFLGFVL